MTAITQQLIIALDQERRWSRISDEHLPGNDAGQVACRLMAVRDAADAAIVAYRQQREYFQLMGMDPIENA